MRKISFVIIFLFVFPVYAGTKASSKPVMATFNQLMAMPKNMRHSYLAEMQNYVVQLERQIKKKKYSALEPSNLIWQLLIEKAYAAGKRKTCMNLGWFKASTEKKSCNPNFEITEAVIAGSKYKAWKKELLVCSKPGEQLCNPSIFGPGVCVSTNNTSDCVTKSQNVKGAGKGLAGLLKKLEVVCEKQSADKEATSCAGLRIDYNSFVDTANQICEEGNSTVCRRAQKAYRSYSKKVDGLAKGSFPLPQSPKNCSYVGSALQLNLGCKSETMCVASVAGCPKDLREARFKNGIKVMYHSSDVGGTYKQVGTSDQRMKIPTFPGSGAVVCKLVNGACPQDPNTCLTSFLESYSVVLTPRQASESLKKSSDKNSKSR